MVRRLPVLILNNILATKEDKEKRGEQGKEEEEGKENEEVEEKKKRTKKKKRVEEKEGEEEEGVEGTSRRKRRKRIRTRNLHCYRIHSGLKSPLLYFSLEQKIGNKEFVLEKRIILYSSINFADNIRNKQT